MQKTTEEDAMNMPQTVTETRPTSTMSQQIHLAPRRLRWDFSSVPQVVASGDPCVAAFFAGASYFLIAFEDFGIPVVRRELPKLVNHPALAREAQAFIAQEALHSQGHALLNQRLESEGLVATELQQEARRMIGELTRGSQRDQVAAVSALEHIIFALSDWLQGADEVLARLDPEVRRLYLWHAMEETEHTAVVQDIYEHVYGSGPEAYQARLAAFARVSRIATRTLVNMWRAVLPQMAAAIDSSTVPPIPWRPILRGSVKYIGEYLRFLKPNFEPWVRAMPVDNLPSLRRQMRDKPAASEDWRTVQVESVRKVAEDVCAYELLALDDKPLPAWTAGAHIDVEIEAGIVRQYSLCGDPADRDRYLIAVKRDELGRGGSLRMHQEITRNSRLRIGSPRNNFELTAAGDDTEVVLLAGGIGITPLMSMAHCLHRRGTPFTLHLCAREASLVPFSEQLGKCAFAGSVQVHLDSSARKLGKARVDIAALIPVWEAEKPRAIYICGPAAFIDTAVALATSAGWPGDAVHVERFAHTVAAANENQPFTLHLARSGLSFSVMADETIVEAMEARGLQPTTSCREGICGTCICRVTAGDVEHRDAILSDIEHRQEKRIAICVSRAKGTELTLDL